MGVVSGKSAGLAAYCTIITPPQPEVRRQIYGMLAASADDYRHRRHQQLDSCMRGRTNPSIQFENFELRQCFCLQLIDKGKLVFVVTPGDTLLP